MSQCENHFLLETYLSAQFNSDVVFPSVDEDKNVGYEHGAEAYLQGRQSLGARIPRGLRGLII